MTDRMGKRAGRTAAVLILAFACLGIGPEACKDQFQVNPPGEGRDWEGWCAGHSAAGTFVAVWAHSDTSGPDVEGQLFDFRGSPVAGGDFQANTSSGADRTPAAAMNSSGAFVIAWCDDDTEEICARTYSAEAVSTSAELKVTSVGTDSYIRTNPKVALTDTGAFAVVWEEAEYDFDAEGYLPPVIKARFYDAAAAPVIEHTVNLTTTGAHLWPAVAALTGGDYVIAWAGVNDILARRYTENGSSTTAELVLNSAPGWVSEPALAEMPGGGYAAVWRGEGFGSDLDGIHLRLFAADDTPLAAETQINTEEPGAQYSPVVDADASGHLTVVWESDQSSFGDDDLSSIQGRVFEHDLTPYLGQFQVNTRTEGAQTRPSVAFDISGSFAVVWDEEIEIDTFNSERNVQGKCYRLREVIFWDDFESGGTTNWSSTL